MRKLLIPNCNGVFICYQKMIAIIVALFCNVMLFAEDVDDLPPPGDGYYAANWVFLGIGFVIIIGVLALLLVVLVIAVAFAIILIALLFSPKYRPIAVCYLLWIFSPFALPNYAKKKELIKCSWKSKLLVAISPFMMFLYTLMIFVVAIIVLILVTGTSQAALEIIKTVIIHCLQYLQ